MEQSDVDAARALLDQLRTEQPVVDDIVAPPELALVPNPFTKRPLPPPAPDPRDAPLPPAPPEARDYDVAHQAQLCRQCGAPLAIARDWCERCLTPL